MWPIVGGVVIACLVVLRGAKRQRERRREVDRIREMQDRQRRELGEEPLLEMIPSSADPREEERAA
jgi:hypothetical protein